MQIEKIYVKTFQSGARAGEWRKFKLPEGAVILSSRTLWVEDGEMMVIVCAVPCV